MIPQKFIDEIQARTDIAEVISGYIPLKRAGRNFRALCPFHGEKTPSFMISPQKQIFHCFGCGEGGGAIQFLMLYEKVTFVEAVEILAGRLGIEIPYQRGEGEKIKTVLFDAVNEASLFFHHNLKDSRSAPVMKYLSQRGISKDIIEKFRLGYAFGKNTLSGHLRKKDFSLKVLETASLIVPSENGFRDIFQDRVVFPIYDARSRVVGFGARLWRENIDAPKYINSLENPLYSKREYLYGLNYSKEDILKQDCAIIVEGYLDMISPFAAGIKNIVASLGTALTVEQIRLIKRYTSNVILLFDADKAGRAASLRALDLLLENDLKVRIVELPAGADPDSLVRERGKDYFSRQVSRSLDFFEYKMKILIEEHDVNSVEGKAKVAKDIFSTLNKLNSEIEKYEYIKKISSPLEIKEEILISEFRKMFPPVKGNHSWEQKSRLTGYGVFDSARPLSCSSGEKDEPPMSIAEKVIVKFMVNSKKAFFLIKKNLNEEDLMSPLAKRVVSYFFEHYPQGDDFSCPAVLGAIQDKEVSRLVSRILIDEDIPLDKEVFRSSLIKLKKIKMKKMKGQLIEEIGAAEKRGDTQGLKVLINKYDKINSEVRNG